MVGENILLGLIEMMVPKAPAGQEAIDVRFTYDTSGLLEVLARRVKGDEPPNRLVIRGAAGNLTPKEIEAKLNQAEPLSRLHLLQERKDLQAALEKTSDVQDVAKLEKDFIKVAKSYGQRKGLDYATWRSAGVSASVLQQAGITRTRA